MSGGDACVPVITVSHDCAPWAEALAPAAGAGCRAQVLGCLRLSMASAASCPDGSVSPRLHALSSHLHAGVMIFSGFLKGIERGDYIGDGMKGNTMKSLTRLCQIPRGEARGRGSGRRRGAGRPSGWGDTEGGAP